MKKLILLVILNSLSVVAAAQTAVEAMGDTGHYRMTEKASMDIAKMKAKDAAREQCESKSLAYGSWTYSQWYQYGRDPNSSIKAERDGFRHTVRIKALCK